MRKKQDTRAQLQNKTTYERRRTATEELSRAVSSTAARGLTALEKYQTSRNTLIQY